LGSKIALGPPPTRPCHCQGDRRLPGKGGQTEADTQADAAVNREEGVRVQHHPSFAGIRPPLPAPPLQRLEAVYRPMLGRAARRTTRAAR
jgi:hypothetical protein